MQALKYIGTDRARQLIQNWEEDFLPESKPKLSKTKLRLVEKLGEAVMATAPTSKRVGRKPDPNSAFQRVKASVEKLLAKAGEEGIHIDHLYPQVVKETGLPLAICKVNAVTVKGVIRNYGHWQKAA